ncbi:hypothetical protein NSERUTF1_7111 [Nocardia seriolae]|nr:hypothetical protein NSERUTF1_7111 [Nocardia seriolae]
MLTGWAGFRTAGRLGLRHGRTLTANRLPSRLSQRWVALRLPVEWLTPPARRTGSKR